MTHPTLDPHYVLPVIDRSRRRAVQQTSVDAHKKLRNRTRDYERVVHVIKVAQLAGIDGLTAREICQAYQDTFQDKFFPSDASPVLHRLRSQGLVERITKRECSVTGEKVWVHRCPMKQSALL